MIANPCDAPAIGLPDFATRILEQIKQQGRDADDDLGELNFWWSLRNRSECHQCCILLLPVLSLHVLDDILDDGLGDLFLEKECKLLETAESRERVAPLVIILFLLKINRQNSCKNQLKQLSFALIDIILGLLVLLLHLCLHLGQGRPELKC